LQKAADIVNLYWGKGKRDMQRIYQVTALCFIALSTFVVWEARNLEYYTKLGPGGGFFPLWLGVVMGGLSFAWLVQVSRQERSPQEVAVFPERLGIMRILLTVVALVVMAGFMNLLGFQVTMFLFLVFLLRVLGGQSLWVTLISALLGSVGIYHLFVRYLDVSLPPSAVKFLAHLGL
jgi:putative tricarboxylic transport membrane protein